LTQFDPQQELFNTPTMGQWGLILTGMLLAVIGTWLMIRRRALGGWGTGLGIILMLFAVLPNMVGTARSVDPVIVNSGPGGVYTFNGVAVGQWGISAYKENYMLTSSSLPSGIVPVAVNVATAGDNINVNLTLQPSTCPAAKGIEAPESVPPEYWAKIRTSREWNELAPEIGKAGTQIHEGSATLVRATGSDFASVIVPITSTSIQSNQSRNFVSHFSGTGEYLGSYVIDLVSPVGVFDEGTGVVPDVIRLTTPDGRLIAEARYHNGQLVSHVEGPGMPRIQTCAGFVRCLLTKWAGIPGWIRRICKGACVSCFTTPAGVPCAACAACVIVYVGVCWCQNAPCPP